MTQLKVAEAASEHRRSDDSSRRARLGDWLVAHGFVSTGDVESALAEQRVTGDPLGGLLVARGVIDEEDLSRALAGIFDLPYRDLVESPPDPEAVARLPQNFCRRRGVLPVGFDGTTLFVAISDPADVLTLDDAQVVAGTRRGRRHHRARASSAPRSTRSSAPGSAAFAGARASPGDRTSGRRGRRRLEERRPGGELRRQPPRPRRGRARFGRPRRTERWPAAVPPAGRRRHARRSSTSPLRCRPAS